MFLIKEPEKIDSGVKVDYTIFTQVAYWNKIN